MKPSFAPYSLLALSLLMTAPLAHADASPGAATDQPSATEVVPAKAPKKPWLSLSWPPAARAPKDRSKPAPGLFELSPSAAVQKGPGLPRTAPMHGTWMPVDARLPDGTRASSRDNSAAATKAMSAFSDDLYRGTQPLHERGLTPQPIGTYQPHFQSGFEDPTHTWAIASSAPSFPAPPKTLLIETPAGLEALTGDASPYPNAPTTARNEIDRYRASWSLKRPDAPAHMPDGSYSKLNEYGVPVAYTPEGVAVAAYVDGEWQAPTETALKSGPYVAGDYVGLNATDAFQDTAGSGMDFMQSEEDDSSLFAMDEESGDVGGGSKMARASSGRDSGATGMRVFDVATGKFTEASGKSSSGGGATSASALLAQSALPPEMQEQLKESGSSPEVEAYLKQRESLAGQASSYDSGINPDGTYSSSATNRMRAVTSSVETKDDTLNALLLCGTNITMAQNDPECVKRVKQLCRYDWKEGVMRGPAQCSPFKSFF